MFQPHDVDIKGNTSVSLCRDIALVLDQKKAASYGLDAAINEMLSRVRQAPLSDSYSGLSDDDLISVIKSRYIQAPCELLQWSEWLEIISLPLNKQLLKRQILTVNLLTLPLVPVIPVPVIDVLLFDLPVFRHG